MHSERGRKPTPSQQSSSSFSSSSSPSPTYAELPLPTTSHIPEDKRAFDSLFDLCAYLDTELELHMSGKKQFDFQTVYHHLSSACKKLGFKLEDVRERNGFTLLHVLIALKDVKSLAAMLQNPNKDSSVYIPANVRHLTTRNLLHFCAYWSKPAAVEKDKPPVNARLIEIAKLLSDPGIPNYLTLDLKMTVDAKYASHAAAQGVPYTVKQNEGSTHAHQAAKNGAADLLYFFHSRSTVSAYDIKRDDGKTPLDVAKEYGHHHIEALALASVKKANITYPVFQSLFAQNPTQTQSVSLSLPSPNLSNANWLAEFAEQMGGDMSAHKGALREKTAVDPAVTAIQQGMK